MAIIKQLNIKGATVYIDDTYVMKDEEVQETLKRIAEIAIKVYKNKAS